MQTIDVKASLLGALTLLAATGSSVAQEKIKLKLAHGYPETHFLWQQGGKVFADAMTAATNGQVQFEVYPANQLGKEQFSSLTTGLADIAMITPAIAGGKLSLVMKSLGPLPGSAVRSWLA